MDASRAWFLKLAAAIGDSFVTNRRRPILTLVEDTSGCAHDTLIAPCDSERYRLLGVEGDHDNCRDNLHAALAELGVAIPATPPSLNVFMNIVDAGRSTRVGRADVTAGKLRGVPRRDGPGHRLLRVPPGHPAHQWPRRSHARGALRHRARGDGDAHGVARAGPLFQAAARPLDAQNTP